MAFTANVFNDSDRLKYEWSISNGIIEEGQGTLAIKVSTSEIGSGEVKAIVKIIGLPKECPNSASNVGYIANNIDVFPVDQYKKIPFKEEKTRISVAARQLQERKDSTVLFIFSLTDKDSLSAFKTRTRNILKYLNETLKIPIGKFAFILGGSDRYDTKIYIQPAEYVESISDWKASDWEKKISEIEAQRKSSKIKQTTKKSR